jgi:hypothetical protein
VVAVNSGATAVAVYGYDALGRRVQEAEGGATTDLYYSSSWQVLEEQQHGATVAQYLWSPVYPDTRVLRDRSSGGALTDRLYAVQDANGDVVAVVGAGRGSAAGARRL